MKTKLKDAMKQAMKDRNQVRLDTIRSLLSAIQYEEIQKQSEDLSQDALLSILQRELKKRHEEIEYAQKAARADLIEKLQLECSSIQEFLPKQLSDVELEQFVLKCKKDNPGANVGSVMKALQASYSGQYNGKTASEIVKRVLG